MQSKTEQTFEFIKKKCEQIRYGRWQVELVIHDGEIAGLTQVKEPHIEFRAETLDKR